MKRHHAPPDQSPNQIKHALRMQGLTLRAFAEANGFKVRAVSDVVRGINRGRFGKGREIREALGLPVEE